MATDKRLSPMEQLARKDMEMRSDIMKQMFQEMTTDAMRTIPEYLFVENFLPFFCGENKENSRYLLTTWYQIAGTPYASVRVLDASNRHVATVPPILNREALASSNENKTLMNIESLFNAAAQQATLSSNMANSTIVNGLANKYLTGLNQESQNKLVSEWRALFDYYGKLPKTGASTASSNKADESDFDYE